MDKVVVEGCPPNRRRVDTDVAGGTRAVDPVLDADVVGDRGAGRAALDVDAGGDIVVDRVREHSRSARLDRDVDPVVTVAVADVVRDDVVRRSIELHSGILVVMADVPSNGVLGRCIQADSRRSTLEQLRVPEAAVARDLVLG